jgi:hypothetical protein
MFSLGHVIKGYGRLGHVKQFISGWARLGHFRSG